MAEASGRGQFRGVEAPIHYLNTMPFTAPGWRKRKPGDWAGVEGLWKRAISFMDYRDLVVYNVSIRPSVYYSVLDLLYYLSFSVRRAAWARRPTQRQHLPRPRFRGSIPPTTRPTHH